MPNLITSLLRTVIPTVWGTALAWLVTHKVIDAEVAAFGEQVGTELLVPITVGVVYLAIRLVEPHLPAFLVRLLAGSAQSPVYEVEAPAAPDLNGYSTRRRG